jgi:Flp pilus assembly protein TadG
MLRGIGSNSPAPSAAAGRQWRLNTGNERGQAMLETAVILPIILLVCVSIFEFGRAYQTTQVLTNAAREGARVAVLPSSTTEDVQARVSAYLQSGQLGNYASATVAVDPNVTISIGASTASASLVTVSYPFSFMVLNPVVNLVSKGSALGDPITLTSSAEMRNEAQ